MTMFKSTQHTDRKKIVIKLGGSMLAGLSEVFFRQLQAIQQNCDVVIIHGGGPAIDEALAATEITSKKINGLRVTDAQSMRIIAKTLIGQVNPLLVGQLNQAGIRAIGLSGQDDALLNSMYLQKEVYGFVGQVNTVNKQLLNDLVALGLTPVVACIGATNEGQLLNINGDTVASAIALALEADELLFVTDVDGIKIDNQVIQHTSKEEIDAWIQSGAIYGGMIPKVEAANNCVKAGVPKVKIVGATLAGTTINREKVFQ